MNMKQFKYVMTIVDKGSFSKAATALNVSQPSLSQYIKKIEDDIGFVLFDRASNELKLTDAGRVYLETGKTIFDAERQMMNKLSDLSLYKIGTITVGISPTRCQYLMPEIVKRFSKEYPKISLNIEERFLSNLVEGAMQGEYDLCVATLPVDKSVFEYKMMMQEEFVLAVPKSLAVYEYFNEHSSKDNLHSYPIVDIRLINGCDYVFLSDTQPTQILINQFCNQYELKINTAVKCMSIETQFSMIKSGIGIGLVPSSVSKYDESGIVAYFSLIQEMPRRDMAVIYRKKQYVSKPIKTLIDIMTSL